MQRVTVVRYTAKAERADENEALSRAVFDELRLKKPGNLAYGLFRSGDEFLHLFINTAEADSKILTGLPSFEAFGKQVSTRVVKEPIPERYDFELVDSYGLA